MAIDDDLDVQATVFWRQVPHQVENPRNYPDRNRPCQSVRNAIRFVMEEIPEHQRWTAEIEAGKEAVYGPVYKFDDIKGAYEGLRAKQPPQQPLPPLPPGVLSNTTDLPPRRTPASAIMADPSRDAEWMTYAAQEAARQRSATAAIAAESVASASVLADTPAKGVFQRLSDNPVEIRAAALSLAEAIRTQIDDLNASRPNDREALTKHDDFVNFLERIAAGLREMADALDRASKADPSDPSQPLFVGKAGEIAKQINIGIMEWLERNRANLGGYTIKFSVIFAGAGLLQALGVDANFAAGIMASLVGIRALKEP
jgi:hypothetical protein